MKKVLFVCLGNICRSPMAEYILRDLAKKADYEIFTASAATCSEEVGNPVYPPARRKLAEHDINTDGKTAVQLKRADYDAYDVIVGMEQRNIRDIMRIVGADPQKKILRLLDLSERPRDIADPWYTGDFDTAYAEIKEGCTLLLAKLRGQRP